MCVKCNKDCFNCQYKDCINDDIYRVCKSPEAIEHRKHYQRMHAKRKREEAKTKGVCIVCQKKKSSHGSKCYECYIRQKRYDRNKYNSEREIWRQKGLCYFCGKQPMEGKKTCEIHYNILLKNIKKCNESENTKKAQADFGRLNRNLGNYSKN